MAAHKGTKAITVLCWAVLAVLLTVPTLAQLIDQSQSPNNVSEGIHKSLVVEIGAGRGDVMTPNSSSFNIGRDPFRAIRRGRQLFQRKFTRTQGQGPVSGDGHGDINSNLAIGAGLSDSCASCHGRPRGSAGFGGDVVTRPDSRDAPHLFGLGIKEMLADEITADLRAFRAQALSEALAKQQPVTKTLTSKGISFGTVTANPDGTFDTSKVEGVNIDLRVRPFFWQGGTVSIREFIIGALNNEMGLQSIDPELTRAVTRGTRYVTPSGMVLDGSTDQLESPPTDDASADPDSDGVVNEIPTAVVDYMEFYLLNYLTAANYEQNKEVVRGRKLFEKIGCTSCHIADLQINRDRRVADVDTTFDATRGIFNNLFATVTPLFNTVNDGSVFPPLKQPALKPFLVKGIFSDFKRHDLGVNFYERNYDGTLQREFLTQPLWGVGSTPPYGHDGRSINLLAVILRHGGEALAAHDAFVKLSPERQRDLIDFLNSLVLFPPDDTASSLDPGNRNTPGFPQFGHGSVKLSVLFLDPSDLE
jgi:hypothetical protein